MAQGGALPSLKVGIGAVGGHKINAQRLIQEMLAAWGEQRSPTGRKRPNLDRGGDFTWCWKFISEGVTRRPLFDEEVVGVLMDRMAVILQFGDVFPEESARPTPATRPRCACCTGAPRTAWCPTTTSGAGSSGSGCPRRRWTAPCA
eukprot:TRINITY_DN22827_c0_g1_i2.p3 TRINITY_DN22827_c0_g1~~TRINITY_DN22827_c0_g1_i2.p3  ORF type:complete len:146 (+),score=18.86 TRINITY_DN22827_c0_g1_i2:84-521(+)